MIGIRDGRRIEGEKTLTLSDFFDGKSTDKPIFYAYADLDRHGSDIALNSETLQDWSVASNLGAVNITFPVPFETMIPKGYDGLLTAGRCMSFDSDISTAVRMQRDMQKAGEAAAMAAYLSIKKNCKLKEVPYDDLLCLLKETACFNEDNNLGFRFDSPYQYDNYPITINWITEPSDIKRALASDKPGVAIWSSKLIGDAIKNNLKNWIKSYNDNLKKHSAFALALLNDYTCLPVLRQIIRSRDNFTLSDCRNKKTGAVSPFIWWDA